MPRIPLITPPNPTIDQYAPAQSGTELIDGYFEQVDGQWVLQKRWGNAMFWRMNVLNGVDGAYWWREKQILVVVIAGRIYAFTSPTTHPVEISTPGCRLKIGHNVEFDTTGVQLLMVNGSRIVRWSGSLFDPARYLTDDRAPNEARTVAVIDGRIVCDEVGFSRALYTDVIGPLDTSEPIFDATNDITPESSADEVTAVRRNGPELVLFGKSSVEFYVNQGTAYPWIRAFYTGEYGLASPASIAKYRGTLFWITNERTVVVLQGHDIQVISGSIQRELANLRRIDDARGFMLDRWYVITFPADNLTWAFDTNTRTWARWGWWNPDRADHDRYSGNCAIYCHDWNMWVVGGKSNGALFRAADTLYSDFYHPIRTIYRSAHIDHGTYDRKRTRRLSVRFRREEVS